MRLSIIVAEYWTYLSTIVSNNCQSNHRNTCYRRVSVPEDYRPLQRCTPPSTITSHCGANSPGIHTDADDAGRVSSKRETDAIFKYRAKLFEAERHSV